MLKLMKYELRKTLTVKLVILALTLVLEAVFLFGLYGHKDSAVYTGVILLCIMSFTGVFAIGVQSVLTLHRDMNTKQSYMLFMTPNSYAKILGSKVVECGLSVLIAGAFYFALGALDIKLLMGNYAGLEELMDVVESLITSFTNVIRFDLDWLLTITFLGLCAFLRTVTAAYFAVTVAASLLNGKKIALFIGFLIFCALNFAVSYLFSLFPDFTSYNAAHLVQSGYELVISTVFYIVTSYIMGKYLSV